MSTFNLHRFTNIETLRSIAPQNLLALLRPYAGYLATRDLVLPSPDEAETLNYEQLIAILRNPTPQMPASLIDHLYLLHEMSTPRAMGVLIVAASAAGVTIDSSIPMTPADFAFHVWTRNSALIEMTHSRLVLRRRRRRDCFPAYGPDVSPTMPSEAEVIKLAESLSAFFIENHRDRHCQIYPNYMKERWEWTIAHGGLYDRIESVEGDDVTTKLLRPRQYATVALDLLSGELSLNTQVKRAKELFRFHFGKLLYNDPNRFPGSNKYSLSPLITKGVDSLAASPAEGIDDVKLKRVLLRPEGPGDPYEIRGAADLFEYLEATGQTLSEDHEIEEVVLSVLFAGSRTWRSVSICRGNVASYTRDEDAIRLEAWMRTRGFILPKPVFQAIAKDETLVNA
ncbi:hypothetical protein SH139x_002006 [Planctomycetaceae bacterium SH139]